MSEQTLLRGVYIHNPLPGMKNSKEKDTPKTGKQSSAVKGIYRGCSGWKSAI